MEKSDIILFFLHLQNQTQVLHWQTTSFARHKAFDDTYNALGGHIDAFIEIYQGKYGRIYLEGNSPYQLHDIDGEDVNGQISDWIEVLTVELPSILDDMDTDLLNIRDEMLSILNKLKYLLTLK
jgi:hypothetical protein